MHRGERTVSAGRERTGGAQQVNGLAARLVTTVQEPGTHVRGVCWAPAPRQGDGTPVRAKRPPYTMHSHLARHEATEPLTNASIVEPRRYDAPGMTPPEETRLPASCGA